MSREKMKIEEILLTKKLEDLKVQLYSTEDPLVLEKLVIDKHNIEAQLNDLRLELFGKGN